ncbi:hypothetical protein COCON_G00131940 [Conger conger]|uniref:UPAR/Ly6 domain-containing protein n=1 Tax=Conger conger TaxID=82655 RepID=A0A9Q1DDZ7_CONCO|nr:hypothetical protein COCON_G00131940 [Conger conger]
MKVLVFSLTLLLILTCGEALKCNRCVPYRSGGCTNRVERCGYGKTACVSASFTIPPYSSFRRCISKYDCRLLQGSPYINAYCCDTNRCN